MIELVRIGVGLLFVLNVAALVVLSTACYSGLSKPRLAVFVLSAINILANALIFYALERM